MAKRKRTRRPRGEGAAWFDEASGRYFYRITIDGKRRTVADADPARAKAKFEKLRALADRQVDIDAGRQTLQTYLATWLESSVRRRVKKSTFADYRKRIEYTILPTLGDHRLIDLTPAIIRDWINAAIDEGIAPTSIRQALGILRRSLATAAQDRLIPYNVAADLEVPIHPDSEDDGETALTVAQTAALLAAVEGHFLAPLYAMALKLGMRRGELLGLRWQDIDLDARLLRVQQQVVAIDGKVQVSSPKTRAARRAIPLTDGLVALLRSHRARLAERRLRAGAAWQDNDLVFPSERGTPMSPRNLLRHFTGARARAGLTGVRFHDLRHTAITRMREAGIDPETTAALVGHAHVSVTLNTYSDATEERKRRAMERLG